VANDHNMHAVRRPERVIGTGDALADAFDAAASAVLAWLKAHPAEHLARTKSACPTPTVNLIFNRCGVGADWWTSFLRLSFDRRAGTVFPHDHWLRHPNDHETVHNRHARRANPRDVQSGHSATLPDSVG